MFGSTGKLASIIGNKRHEKLRKYFDISSSTSSPNAEEVTPWPLGNGVFSPCFPLLLYRMTRFHTFFAEKIIRFVPQKFQAK